MSNKTRIEFEGFEEVVARLTKLGGDIKGTTERALKETHRVITDKAEQAISTHKRTGRTEASLKRQADVHWAGTMASVEVGFDIANGGLPSIFLMYGTPKIKKDQKLYNAFYGKQTKEEIMKLQEDIFYEEIRKVDGE